VRILPYLNDKYLLIFKSQPWCFDCRNVGGYAIHRIRVRVSRCRRVVSAFLIKSEMHPENHSGYLESCRAIVTCARTIAGAITTSIPELYVLGSPPASVVAFGSRDPKVNALEVGDAMALRGWHLNALSVPPAVHIACTVSYACVCVHVMWLTALPCDSWRRFMMI
jgi:hypothetical protein